MGSAAGGRKSMTERQTERNTAQRGEERRGTAAASLLYALASLAVCFLLFNFTF